ncbi:MAG: SIS domain-containing protein [Candidatus Fermentibacteraceae bacterium]|nr:SIS domain-containing protein [Candidatus Fermentibacteraceae bacterium]MBN2609017.1 SIS domain-containing protein [Candidatus Fermentibacteraceae bacterium]
MSDIDDYLGSACSAVASLNPKVVKKAAELCIDTVRNGGTIFFCGNGGSAADSQHFAGELVGRFRMERRALPAVALTSNSAIVTAIANDYDFTMVFARQVEALGGPGDLLVAISTSGNSENVLKAVEKAKELDMRTLGLTGESGGALCVLADICVKASSSETCHVQEALLVAGHAICQAVESACARDDGV